MPPRSSETHRRKVFRILFKLLPVVVTSACTLLSAPSVAAAPGGAMGVANLRPEAARPLDTAWLGLALGIQAADDQVQALEKQVQQMLGEARRQQEQLLQIRRRLVDAEAANAWLPWLVLGLMATGALASWLGLRVRRLRREQRSTVLGAPTAASRVDMPPVELPEAGPPLLSAAQPLLSGGASARAGAVTSAAALTIDPPVVVAPPASAMAQARPSTPVLKTADFALGTNVPLRPVSVEELLDLDQQVDFFMVLGQEQAAIDLLLGHVRSTGGSNALPYFKLLEIYRTVGDEEAYERTRDRFNQRFNALAPDWSGDLLAGRALEDYPAVMARLQRAWPQPLRAVAELESLLLRRADLEPFDLPAYRDVLLLHALVRELPMAALEAASPLDELPPGDDSAVDLLLPLDDDGESPDTTSPRPHLSSESRAVQSRLAEWAFSRNVGLPRLAGAGAGFDDPQPPARPAKLDLDLSEFAPAPREFTRPAAFTDVDMRSDIRRSDLTPFDDSDLPSHQPTTRH
jgi:hypothetical protein